MNTKDEALQMAIEELMKALKLLQRFEPQIVGGDVTAWTVGLRNQLSDLQHTLYNNGLVEAINACKEALEQPAQEPHYYAHRLERCLEDLPSEHITLHREFISDVAKTIRNTHPHQWQGLTDDEIEKIDDKTILATEFARAIEAKLKEKEKNYETT